jgi:hypothetical protein
MTVRQNVDNMVVKHNYQSSKVSWGGRMRNSGSLGLYYIRMDDLLILTMFRAGGLKSLHAFFRHAGRKVSIRRLKDIWCAIAIQGLYDRVSPTGVNA